MNNKDKDYALAVRLTQIPSTSSTQPDVIFSQSFW